MPAAEWRLNAGSRLREPCRLSAPPPSLPPRRQVCVRKIVKTTLARRSALRASCQAAPGTRRGGRSHYVIAKELIVVLIAYYVAFMIAGDLAAYAIGLVTELEFGGHVSLIVFLALYFLFLWIAWILAVWLTKPKHAEPQSAQSA
jgi:hypothetical protein